MHQDAGADFLKKSLRQHLSSKQTAEAARLLSLVARHILTIALPQTLQKLQSKNQMVRELLKLVSTSRASQRVLVTGGAGLTVHHQEVRPIYAHAWCYFIHGP